MDTRDAGRLGGKKVLQERGKEYFKILSRKGVEARKRNRIKAENMENSRKVGNI